MLQSEAFGSGQIKNCSTPLRQFPISAKRKYIFGQRVEEAVPLLNKSTKVRREEAATPSRRSQGNSSDFSQHHPSMSGDVSAIIENLKNFRKNRRYNNHSPYVDSALKGISKIPVPSNRSTSNPRPSNYSNHRKTNSGAVSRNNDKAITRSHMILDSQNGLYGPKEGRAERRNWAPPSKTATSLLRLEAGREHSKVGLAKEAAGNPYFAPQNRKFNSTERSKSCVRNEAAPVGSYLSAATNSTYSMEKNAKEGKRGLTHVSGRSFIPKPPEPFQTQKLNKSSTELAFGSSYNLSLRSNLEGAFSKGSNESVEDIHYFLVAFHQKAKLMLRKIENTGAISNKSNSITPIEESDSQQFSIFNHFVG